MARIKEVSDRGGSEEEGSGPTSIRSLEEQRRRAVDRGLRSCIIEALSELDLEGSTEVLLDALDHRDPAIRADAALALGTIGAPQTTAALTRRLSDPDARVRKSAAMALGLIVFLPRP